MMNYIENEIKIPLRIYVENLRRGLLIFYTNNYAK